MFSRLRERNREALGGRVQQFVVQHWKRRARKALKDRSRKYEKYKSEIKEFQKNLRTNQIAAGPTDASVKRCIWNMARLPGRDEKRERILNAPTLRSAFDEALAISGLNIFILAIQQYEDLSKSHDKWWQADDFCASDFMSLCDIVVVIKMGMKFLPDIE